MVCSCAVVTCKTSKTKNPNLSFFRIPDPYRSKSSVNIVLKDLMKKRRLAWCKALSMEDLIERSSYKRICSLHFRSGKPARPEDVDNVDWIPNINLGVNDAEENTKIENLPSRNITNIDQSVSLNAEDSIVDLVEVTYEDQDYEKEMVHTLASGKTIYVEDIPNLPILRNFGIQTEGTKVKYSQSSLFETNENDVYEFHNISVAKNGAFQRSVSSQTDPTLEEFLEQRKTIFVLTNELASLKAQLEDIHTENESLKLQIMEAQEGDESMM